MRKRGIRVAGLEKETAYPVFYEGMLPTRELIVLSAVGAPDDTGKA